MSLLISVKTDIWIELKLKNMINTFIAALVALRIAGTDTVLKTKLFGLKVRHFNNSCLLIAFTRSIYALFSAHLHNPVFEKIV